MQISIKGGINVAKERVVYGFVRRKIELLDEETAWSRGMLAKLRRGIGKQPGAVPDIWEITLADAPEEWHSNKYGTASSAELAVHTALTLYALHRQGKLRSMSISGKTEDGKSAGDSFGAAAARLVQPDGSNLNAIKRRFDAVATAAEFTELSRHARGIVQLLKAADQPMDYPQFADDLYIFQIPGYDDGIRLRWGEDFYRTLKVTDGKEDEAK